VKEEAASAEPYRLIGAPDRKIGVPESYAPMGVGAGRQPSHLFFGNALCRVAVVRFGWRVCAFDGGSQAAAECILCYGN
jgi:hypothetical protein